MTSEEIFLQKVTQEITDKWVKVLEMEVNVLRSRIRKHDTGHLHTTIGVLERRIKELRYDNHNRQSPKTDDGHRG
jgi:hypothetical protein